MCVCYCLCARACADVYGTAGTVTLSANTMEKLKTYSGFVNASYADLLAHPDRFSAGDQYDRQVNFVFAFSLWYI